MIERWEADREGLFENRADIADFVRRARQTGDLDDVPLYYGQDAGLINDIPNAGQLVKRIVAQAETTLDEITKRH